MNNIQIIGMGYIGLPLACLLANKKKITCVDIDKTKIKNLKKSILPFKEKNLKNLFTKNFSKFSFDHKISKIKKKKYIYNLCSHTFKKK